MSFVSRQKTPSHLPNSTQTLFSPLLALNPTPRFPTWMWLNRRNWLGCKTFRTAQNHLPKRSSLQASLHQKHAMLDSTLKVAWCLLMQRYPLTWVCIITETNLRCVEILDTNEILTIIHHQDVKSLISLLFSLLGRIEGWDVSSVGAVLIVSFDCEPSVFFCDVQVKYPVVGIKILITLELVNFLVPPWYCPSYF